MGGGTRPPDSALLQELVARFIANCPPEELASWERAMFLVEQAWWFYEDFCRDRDPTLQSLPLRGFCALLFREHPSLQPHLPQVDSIYQNFNAYKHTVPCFGVILLNCAMDKCLMVRGWNSKTWGFPKGKINKDEAEIACAAREVVEEVGFDVAPLIREHDYVEALRSGQRTKLFIVPGLDEATACFATQTRREISEIAWHWVDDLPVDTEKNADGTLRYYMVQPFTAQLRKWIARRKKAEKSGRVQQAMPQQPQQQPLPQRDQGAQGSRAAGKQQRAVRAPALRLFAVDSAAMLAAYDRSVAGAGLLPAG